MQPIGESRESKNSCLPSSIAAGSPDTRLDGSRPARHGPRAERHDARRLVGREARHLGRDAVAGHRGREQARDRQGMRAPEQAARAWQVGRASGRVVSLDYPRAARSGFALRTAGRAHGKATGLRSVSRGTPPGLTSNDSSQAPGMWNIRPRAAKRPSPAAATVGR